MTQWITKYDPAAAILAHKGFAEVTFKGLVPLLGHVIVTLEGEAHRVRRTIEGRLFVSSLLKSYEQTVIPAIIREALEPLSSTGRGCLVQISQHVTSRIAAKLIGIDALNDGAATAEAMFLLSALVSGTQNNHSDQPPLTRREARNRLRERFIFPAIQVRQRQFAAYQAGKISRDDLPNDLIMALLAHTEQKWEPKQIAGEAAFYAVAGVDTTATLIPHLLHELWQWVALNPQYVTKLPELEFLRLAAAEALRLHPVLPTLFRQATQAIEIEGYTFQAGEVAGLYLTDANRDATVFGDDANRFNPLRMLPSRVRRVGLSFGGGTHLCLGRELALGTTLMGDNITADNSLELFGEAALLAKALFELNAQPDPAQPVTLPDYYKRDVYHRYPIILP